MEATFSEVLPSVAIPLWQLEPVERSLDPLTMVHPGVIQLLEFQLNSMESPSGTIPSWQWDQVEPFLPLQMELRGPLELLELQDISMELPSNNKYL